MIIKVGDKVYNFGRLEEVIKIERKGIITKYYTKTKTGAINFFTNKDLCEHSIRNKRIASGKDKSAVDVLMSDFAQQV